ncbi:MAG: hypothetical protein Q8Q09_13120 [Deltaproteobacteria bacterium]|nr:hypothetical protein [Deltaproteobacteria bacterium]
MSVLRAAVLLGRDATRVALMGIPAVRAALHGARLGAGTALTSEVIERLGIAVLPAPAQLIARGIIHGKKQLGVVFSRRGGVLRAEARRVVMHTADGLTLSVSPGGEIAASTSADAVRSLARSSTRAALKGLGRAAVRGAAAGAVIDGSLAALGAWRAHRAGTLDGGQVRTRIALGTARGALAGAVGVGAAGVVSAGVALTGLSIAGAPFVLPLVTMAAASTLVGRVFDRTVSARVLALEAATHVTLSPATHVD